jgi:phosphatidate phosphatase APP1
VEVARARVTIDLPGAPPVTVGADHDGYLDAVVEAPGLDPGWHEARLTLDDGTAATAQVAVVDPAAQTALVSDVDDTILETGLTRGLEFLRITLLTEVHERSALPGAAALYRALDMPVFYLSTSPWNLHEMLLEFIALRRFPLGPLLLTDWGPSRSGLFRVGAQEHKIGVVRSLLAVHPQLRLLLVGDSGQADPEIYATLARDHPDRIRAVYIRRTRHALPGRVAEVDALAGEVTAGGVPMLAVDNSMQIAVHAAELGLLDAAALAEVRAD